MEKFREKLREILNSTSILTLLFIKTCFNNKKVQHMRELIKNEHK